MLLFQNLQVVDSQSPFHGKWVDILVDNQCIVKIAEANTLQADTVISAEGLCISPGWVDMQVHLSDPGFEQKETLAELAEAGKKGGFTHLLCYPNTQPMIDNTQVLTFLQKRSEPLPIRLHFAGCLTHEAQGKDFSELYEMHKAGAVAFTDGANAVQSAGMGMRLRQYVQPFNPLLMTALQEKTLSFDGMMNEGRSAVHLGMKGIPAMAEDIALAKELALHEYAPVRTHFQPVTSPEALLKLQEAKQKYPQISVGTAIPYLALTDDALFEFDTNLKIFPPLRSPEQVAALKTAIQTGIIDTLSSAHCAQGLEEKDCEFENAEAGMLNVQTFFALANETLVASGLISLARLIAIMSQNPRKILGLPTSIVQENAPLDFTLFQPQTAWQLTAKDIPSRAKNSPFLGKELKGKVWGVLVGR